MVGVVAVLEVLQRDQAHDPIQRSHVELLPEQEVNASLPGRMTSLSIREVVDSRLSSRSRNCPYLQGKGSSVPRTRKREASSTERRKKDKKAKVSKEKIASLLGKHDGKSCLDTSQCTR